jgi:hypothetical protein
MSTDVKEWVVDRGVHDGESRRYLEDHAYRSGDDVLMWTSEPRDAWRLERRDAENYAKVSYRKAVVIHEDEMTPGATEAKFAGSAGGSLAGGSDNG